MITSSACPLVVAIDGYFYAACPKDGDDPRSDLVMLRHISLGHGEPQATRFVSANLLLELIAADDAVPVIGDLTERYDSEDGHHQTAKGSIIMPSRPVGEPAFKVAA